MSVFERFKLHPGATVSGNVVIELNRSLSFKVLSATFSGVAFVYWKEWTKRFGLKTIQVSEQYFNYTQFLRGGEEGRPLTLLAPRETHIIPFQYQIPSTLPSSFAGERGRVTYTITVCMEYPDRMMSEPNKVVKEFKVMSPVDLNLRENIQRPIILVFENDYGFFVPRKLRVVVRLPVAGFCPGQRVPVQITAQNETSIEVRKIVLQLVKKERYLSQESIDYFTSEKVLATIRTGAILSYTDAEFTTGLVVPQTMVPTSLNLQRCGIISVGVFFKVTIKMSGKNKKLVDQAEICIGSVPLANIRTIYPSSSMQNLITPSSNFYSSQNNPNSNMPYRSYVAPYPNPTVLVSNSTVPYSNRMLSNLIPPLPYPNSIVPRLNPTLPYSNSTLPYPNSRLPNLNISMPISNPRNSTEASSNSTVTLSNPISNPIRCVQLNSGTPFTANANYSEDPPPYPGISLQRNTSSTRRLNLGTSCKTSTTTYIDRPPPYPDQGQISI